MISWLKGEIIQSDAHEVILSCNGVGYQLFCPNHTLQRAGRNIGEQLSFYVHTQVREDHINLYGFENETEKKLFLLINSVSGIGAKTSMTFLSHLSLSQIVEAISNRDLKIIQTVPGIGKKSAERIAVELSDKIEKLGVVTTQNPARKNIFARQQEELLSALSNLGYKSEQIEDILSEHPLSKDMSIEESIRQTLKHLAR